MAKLKVETQAKTVKTGWYYYVLCCSYLNAKRLAKLADKKPVIQLYVNGQLVQSAIFHSSMFE